MSVDILGAIDFILFLVLPSICIFSPHANYLPFSSSPSLPFHTLPDIIVSNKSTNFLDFSYQPSLATMCKGRLCQLCEGLGSWEEEKSYYLLASGDASRSSSCQLWASGEPMAVSEVFSRTASSADVAGSQ